MPRAAAAPPPSPPRISPDGKWVWDGKQWLPVARRDAVFANWNTVVVESEPAARPVTQQAAQPAADVDQVIPVDQYEKELEERPYVQNMYTQGAESSTPLWDRAQTGLNKYLYIMAGVVILIIAAVWVGSVGPINFPWTPQNTVPPRVTPAPTIGARTDAAAADLYLSGFVSPPLADLSHSMGLLNETCNGPLTLSCRDNISATDSQVNKVTTVMNSHPVPDCISSPVARMNADLATLHKALQLSLQGYQDNKPTELYQGIAEYRSASQSLNADLVAADSAQKTACNTVQTGP